MGRIGGIWIVKYLSERDRVPADMLELSIQTRYSSSLLMTALLPSLKTPITEVIIGYTVE